MAEIWKIIDGFPLYMISSTGRIKNVKSGRIRKPYTTRKGYLRIKLNKDGEHKHEQIHRLVAKAFLPIVPGKDHVNHKNRNKKDNRVENLEWVTPLENSVHAHSGQKYMIQIKKVLKIFQDHPGITTSEFEKLLLSS